MNTTALDFAATDNPEFLWDAKTGRYRYRDTKKFVSAEAVAALTQKRILAAQTDFQQLGQLLIDGKISLLTWQTETAGALKILRSQQYLLGVGGLARMMVADRLGIARQLKEQYAYLREFATTLRDEGMSRAQFFNRLGMYAESTASSYHAGQQSAARAQGYTHSRRQLGATDQHCQDCVRYAAADVQPIGDLPLPKEQCACGSRCRCSLLYLKLTEVI